LGADLFSMVETPPGFARVLLLPFVLLVLLVHAGGTQKKRLEPMFCGVCVYLYYESTLP